MKTRDGLPVQAGSDAGVAVADDRLLVVRSQRPRGRLVIALIAVLSVAVLVAIGLRWFGGGSDGVGTESPAAPANAAPAAPAAPAPLLVEVQGPATIVAGEPARFTVTWADGAGAFSGPTEEWGDGVGVSSEKQQSCPNSAAVAAQGDTYVVRHTFAEAGTYTVRLGVSTYTCTGADSGTEDASQTLTVRVLPVS